MKFIYLFSISLFIHNQSIAQVARVCDAISSATQYFAEDRDSGMTKQQLRNRSIQVAKADKIDDVILDSWFDDIEWVFKSENKKISPVKIKEKRFNECLKELNQSHSRR